LYSEFNFGDGSPPPIESDEWMVDHDLGFGTLDLNAGRARFTNDHPALDGITNGSMFLQGLPLQRMGYFNLIHRLPEMPEEMLEVADGLATVTLECNHTVSTTGTELSLTALDDGSLNDSNYRIVDFTVRYKQNVPHSGQEYEITEIRLRYQDNLS